MTDVRELVREELGWTEAEANAILRVYESDRLATIPSVPQCFIDRSATIGNGTKVWHFAVVLQDVVIGEGSNIGSRCEIGRGSTIGDLTRIGSGTFLPPNSKIGSRVFIGPNCTFTDDRNPVVSEGALSFYHAEPPIIEDKASIGAGAVILPGVTIGYGARIGAGAIVTRNVEPLTLVRGEPARARSVA